MTSVARVEDVQIFLKDPVYIVQPLLKNSVKNSGCDYLLLNDEINREIINLGYAKFNITYSKCQNGEH